MTPRQFRIVGIVLSAASAGLGIWALAEAKYGTCAFWLAMSVAWLLQEQHSASARASATAIGDKVRVTADPGAAGQPASLV